MSLLDLFVLFGLPAIIMAGAGFGIWKLTRPTDKPQAPVEVDYDFTNVVRLPAANE